MSGAELAPTAYINPYSGRETQKFIQSVLKKMERMERSGKYVDALEFCDTQILYCSDVYGHDSDQTWALCERFAATSNALAVAAVQQGSHNQPTKLLRRALAVLRRCSTEQTDSRKLLVQAVTLNNLGTHYRRTDRLRASLSCIEKAVALNSWIENTPQCADTHVNMCATLSMMERHAEAAEHATKAVELLRLETTELEDQKESDSTLEAQWQQRSGVLAVTIYNHGVELEHLELNQAALKAYQEASRVCQRCFGPDHPTSIAMNKSYLDALDSMDVGGEDDFGSHDLLNTHRSYSRSARSSISPPWTPVSKQSHLEADEFVFEDNEASDGESQLGGGSPHNNNKTGTDADQELDALLSLMPRYDELSRNTSK